jgi:hypothetical protein
LCGIFYSRYQNILFHLIDVYWWVHCKYNLRAKILFVYLMVFNATFNNSSAISWRSVLLVEETGRPGENQRPVTSPEKLYHVMLYNSPWSRFELTTSVVIGTDHISSCKSNYHTITAMKIPPKYCTYLLQGVKPLLTKIK